MIKYYKNCENRLCEIESAEQGSWIYVVNPTETEISELEENLHIERDYIRAALDEEEPSRIESDDGVTLIVVDYPVADTENNPEKTLTYTTTPMGIITTGSNVVTVSAKENPIVDDMAKGVVKGVFPHFKTRFVFTILLRIAARYLQYLKQIDKLTSYVEGTLHKSMQNKGLLQDYLVMDVGEAITWKMP